MDFNGYRRTKKFDIKRWFKGTNVVVYAVILILLMVALFFVLNTVIGMHDNNKRQEENASVEETTEEETETQTESEYIAPNQSYSIKISLALHILVVYQLDSNKEFTVPVKAFYVAVGPDVETGVTAIAEKSLWRKIDDYSNGRFCSRLENAEYLCSEAYYSQHIYNLNPASYNSIGEDVSYGSVMMTATNAKWIYENCGTGTTVEICDDFEIGSDVEIEEFETISWSAYRDPLDDPTQTSD